MANKKDALGDRMKGYENITRNYLTRRVPAIIRLDGKAFHTFTRGMVKPFDSVMTQAMQQTMKYLCENIQGCVLGYTQSDEITLVLTDYATIKTDAWFGYNIQKMVSVAASMATLAFDREFIIAHGDWFSKSFDNGVSDQPGFLQLDSLYTSKQHCAMFDARVFSIPKDEVCNCLIWRQQDATRNSIEAVGQAFFSQGQLNKRIRAISKKCSGHSMASTGTTSPPNQSVAPAVLSSSSRHQWTILTIPANKSLSPVGDGWSIVKSLSLHKTETTLKNYYKEKHL